MVQTSFGPAPHVLLSRLPYGRGFCQHQPSALQTGLADQEAVWWCPTNLIVALPFTSHEETVAAARTTRVSARSVASGMSDVLTDVTVSLHPEPGASGQTSLPLQLPGLPLAAPGTLPAPSG